MEIAKEHTRHQDMDRFAAAETEEQETAQEIVWVEIANLDKYAEMMEFAQHPAAGVSEGPQIAAPLA